jgi:hypothetical protein
MDAFAQENRLAQSESLRFPLIQMSPKRRASFRASLVECKEVADALH